MNHVDWLQSVLPATVTVSGIGVFVFILGALILGLLAVGACLRSSQNSRRAERAETDLANEYWWQEQKANSAGPQATAKTLTEVKPNDRK